MAKPMRGYRKVEDVVVEGLKGIIRMNTETGKYIGMASDVPGLDSFRTAEGELDLVRTKMKDKLTELAHAKYTLKIALISQRNQRRTSAGQRKKAEHKDWCQIEYMPNQVWGTHGSIELIFVCDNDNSVRRARYDHSGNKHVPASSYPHGLSGFTKVIDFDEATWNTLKDVYHELACDFDAFSRNFIKVMDSVCETPHLYTESQSPGVELLKTAVAIDQVAAAQEGK